MIRLVNPAEPMTLVTKLRLRNDLGAMLRFAGGCVPGPEQVERPPEVKSPINYLDQL
jgi:hypothetical protein